MKIICVKPKKINMVSKEDVYLNQSCWTTYSKRYSSLTFTKDDDISGVAFNLWIINWETKKFQQSIKYYLLTESKSLQHLLKSNLHELLREDRRISTWNSNIERHSINELWMKETHFLIWSMNELIYSWKTQMKITLLYSTMQEFTIVK